MIMISYRGPNGEERDIMPNRYYVNLQKLLNRGSVT